MLEIKKFHNKLLGVDVEAVKFDGTQDSIYDLSTWVESCGRTTSSIKTLSNETKLLIHTLGGWHEVEVGEWVVRSSIGEIYIETQALVDALLVEIASEPESNLVAHARRELESIGEEPETIAGYLKVIQAFSDMGHSGGSASVAIPTINQLLQYKPLGPITNDPDEWFNHGKDMGGRPGEDFWQNKRDGEAFSNDGGKTYYLLSERPLYQKTGPLHTSVAKVKKNV